MYCGHCGQKLADDARFCPACGQRTAQPMASSAQSQAPAAPQIAYDDYWKALKQFGVGMKWYAFLAIVSVLDIPVVIANFAMAIDNLGGVHDAYYILLALLSAAMGVAYGMSFACNIHFKKNTALWVYSTQIIGMISGLSELILLPMDGLVTTVLVIVMALSLGMLAVNYAYFKKRIPLLRD